MSRRTSLLVPPPTETVIPTLPPTETATEVPSATPLPTDTATALPTLTETPLPTATETETLLPVPTASETATETALPTASETATGTAPAIETVTPTINLSPSATATPTATPPPKNGQPQFASASFDSAGVRYRYASDINQLRGYVTEANNNATYRYVIWLTSASYDVAVSFGYVPLGLIDVRGDIIIVRDEAQPAASITKTGGENYRLFYTYSTSRLLLINVTISGFGGSGAGSGGAVYNQGEFLTYKARFTNNQGSDGGAIDTIGNVQIWKSIFETNTANGGGAIANDQSPNNEYGNITVHCSTFQNNVANYGGAIASYRGNSVAVSKNNFITNNGGASSGIYNNASHPAIEATGNWWGASSGPNAPSNPSGTGDSITNNIYFAPYVTANAIDITNTTTCPQPEEAEIPEETIEPTVTPTIIFETNTPQPTIPAATATAQAAYTLQAVFPAPLSVSMPRLSDGNADSHVAVNLRPLCSRDMNQYQVSGGNYPVISPATGKVFIVDSDINDNAGLGNFSSLQLPFSSLPNQIQTLLVETYPDIATGRTEAANLGRTDYLLLGFGHLNQILAEQGMAVVNGSPQIGINGKTGLESSSIEHLDVTAFYIANSGADPLTFKSQGLSNPIQNYFGVFTQLSDQPYGIRQAIDPLVLWPFLPFGFTGSITACVY